MFSYSYIIYIFIWYIIYIIIHTKPYIYSTRIPFEKIHVCVCTRTHFKNFTNFTPSFGSCHSSPQFLHP